MGRLAHDLVGAAERNAVAHQVFGQIGGAQRRIPGRFLHPLGIELEAGDEARQHIEHETRGLDGVVEGILGFLQILVVRQGQARKAGEACEAAAALEGVMVLNLAPELTFLQRG